MKKYTYILSLLTAFMCTVTVASQTNADGFDYENERSLRENPVIEGTDDEIDIMVPSYINSDANRIIMNNADWSGIRQRLRDADRTPFSIVHIGDSHIQADIATGQTREFLQYDLGNAGRGLVIPFKMSGTNEPCDYSITSRKPWSSVKLMGQNWKRTMGFTGASVSPGTAMSEITVSTDDKDDYNPFSALTIFHKGQFFVTGVTDARGTLLPFTATPSEDYTHIELVNDVTSVNVLFESAGDLTLFGVNLSGNRPGVFYHTIGNNGATYETYNRIGNVGEGIMPLNPSLVIISLGANEAFGRFNEFLFEKSMDKLVTNIRKANPGAEILLVTPAECQRIKYTTVSSRRKKGRKRRATRRAGSYAVNANILPIRNAILNYGKEHDIAVYDWYDVAGGAGSSSKWTSDGLLGKDRVHLTYKGYHLQGYLIYQVIKDTLYNN